MPHFVLTAYFVMATALFVSCGGAKFSGGSGKDSGSKTEQTTEQPTEVAGGFGLTCMSDDNRSDSLKTDFSCDFVNESDQLFQDAPDKKLDVTVMADTQLIDIDFATPGVSSSFQFSLMTSDISKAQVHVKIKNPLQNDKIIEETSAILINPITQQPQNATAQNGEASFSVVADASQGNILYEWQESPTNAKGSWTPLTNSSPDITGADAKDLTLKNLSANKNNHFYRVKVYLTKSIKWRSKVAQLTVPANPPAPPAPPPMPDRIAPIIGGPPKFFPDVPAPSYKSLSPTIKFNLDASGQVKINLFSDSSCAGSTLATEKIRPPGTDKSVPVTLVINTKGSIYMRATDGAGNTSDCVLVGDYSTLIPIPQNLNVTSAQPSEVNLTWGTVTGAASYVVYFKRAGDATASIIAVNGTSYLHQSLNPGNVSYSVAAVVGSVIGAPSGEMTVMVQAPTEVSNSLFVKVNANSELGTADFWVAKYEMKKETVNVNGIASDRAVSRAAGLPWDTSRAQAHTACQMLGEGYKLISNAQWQAIAREIEGNNLNNWSKTLISEKDYINYGHSDNNPPQTLEAGVDQNPCIGTLNNHCTDNTKSDFSQKRTHTLKSGGIIWDFAGNADEWVSEDLTIMYPLEAMRFTAVPSTTIAIDMVDVMKTYGPVLGRDLPIQNNSPYGGYGVLIYTYLPNGMALIRGGEYSSGDNSGVFTTKTYSENDAAGFRCVSVNPPAP